MQPLIPEIPPAAEHFGFSRSATGGHMARSMMLDEISALVSALPTDSRLGDYRKAILEANALGKPTFSSRTKSYRHVVQLYGLDPSLALFRVLRQFASDDRPSLPLMAMTCSFCRDPQLRHSFGLIDRLRPGETLLREQMEAYLEEGFPGRFSPAMKKSLAQNVNTTWTAAGHLVGKVKKVRTLPTPKLAATVYAMFTGYLLGLRGESLIQSVFGRLIAPDPALTLTHLTTGSARGWLRFRHSGGVMEFDFSPLLTTEEQEFLHGAP